MIEQYTKNIEEEIKEETEKHLTNLKNNIENSNPIDLERMISHGATFGLIENQIGGFFNKEEIRVSQDKFIEAVSEDIGQQGNKPKAKIEENLEPKYYRPGEIFINLPNEKNPITEKNQKIQKAYTSFSEKLNDLTSENNQNYLAKILAGILLKNKDNIIEDDKGIKRKIGCFKVIDSKIEIYDPLNKNMYGKCCFSIRGTKETITSLLQKTFDIVAGRDTITGTTDETLDYLVELSYK